jgi:hypothetical protein
LLPIRIYPKRDFSILGSRESEGGVMSARQSGALTEFSVETWVANHVGATEWSNGPWREGLLRYASAISSFGPKAPPGGLASSPPQYRFLIAGSDITPLLTLEPSPSFCESW